MANHREVLNDRFVAFSGIGKKQSADGVALANADLDTRDKCTITREEIVTRRDIRDCKDQDLIGSKIDSRMARWTFTYNELTPQIIARYTAYLLGSSAAATGTPANEVQTLARTGTVSAGTFTIALTIEGRTVETRPIAFDATTALIQVALTAPRMLFMQPGSVVVSGDWDAGIVLTFGGNMAHADIPLVVIDASGLTGTTPGISVTQTTAGDQNHHALSRSTTREKAKVSFICGWDNDDSANTPEKYCDYVIEQITPGLSLDGNCTLTVQALGPWEYDSLEHGYTVPDCVNIDPLQSQDCRIKIDNVWQTTDINTLTTTINDNVPTDRLSAFPFDGIDVQTLQRGRQPSYGPINIALFGSEIDGIYQLALNERTESPVPVVIHFGFPGNRCTWSFPKTQIRFQNNPMGEAGDARFSTIQIEGIPQKNGTNAPFNATADIDQTAQFLTT